MRVAYCGVPGSYAEMAALGYFGPDVSLVTTGSFGDAFEAVRDGRAERAVLPLENSSTGSISAVYDLIGRYGFSIVGEQLVRVNQCLLVKPGVQLEEITQVCSHEQGLSQSADFLDQHPGWKRTAVYNTAAAARMVSEGTDRGLAAIASSRAAQLYNLDILVDRVNFNEQNQTRFVVLASQPHHDPRNNKVSLMFTLPHESGSLYRLLGIFAREELNLLKIESRPMLGRSWEYLFFLDFAADAIEQPLERILREVADYTSTLRVLGHYRQAEEVSP